MYRTGAPKLAESRAGAIREVPLRPEILCFRTLRSGPTTDDTGVDRYVGDMLAVYGRGYAPGESLAAPAATYTALANETLAALTPRVSNIDMVVLAYARPDADVHSLAGCFIAGALATDPLVFSVCDQGLAAPFTALRVAGDLRREAAHRGRTVVLALDRRALPWDAEPRSASPSQESAVAVVLNRADPGEGLLLLQRTAVSVGEVSDALTEYLSLTAQRFAGPVSLIAGHAVPVPAAIDDCVARIRRVPHGQTCTGAWAIAHGLTGSGKPGPMVLVEYDPDLRYLSMTALAPTVTTC